MKLKKLLLSAITFAAMSVILAVCASADSSGFWTYDKQKDGSIYITGYGAYADTLNIPSTIEGLTVSGISAEAFKGTENFVSVTIPSTVTYIGYQAFSGCTELTSISIPSTVTKFGTAAYSSNCYTFSDCPKLKTVVFDASADVPTYAFKNCTALTTVTIGDHTTGINLQAFYNCTALTSITVGKGVTYIGESSFYGDTALKTVNITGSLVTSIGKDAFNSCGFTAFTIPSSVTYIGAYAFYKTNLTSITVPSTVTSFGTASYSSNCYTFAECPKLKTVSFNATTTVPTYGFTKCPVLTDVVIGDSTTGIDYEAFENCSALKSVKTGNHVEYIGDSAFNGCSSLSSFVYGIRVYNIYAGAFKGCGFTSIAIPNSVTFIGAQAYYNNPELTEVIIPSSVSEWGLERYSSSNYRTFAECPKLKSATIGECVMPGANTLFSNSPNVVINCIKDSPAHKYAVNYGIKNSATLKNIPAEKIVFNKAEYTVKKGEKLYLYPTITPNNTTEGIAWSLTNDTAASVNAGVVEGKSAGLIQVKCTLSGGKFAYCTVNVVEDESAVTSVDTLIKKDLNYAYVKPAISAKTYTGSAITPAFSLMYNEFTKLTPGVDYTATYANNKDVGTATITITGIGIYTGTKTTTFNIVPGKTTGFKLASKTSKSAKLTWNANAAGTGYKIQQYKNNAWTTIQTITDKTVTSFTVTGLSPSTAYKFRVCAYVGNVIGIASDTVSFTTPPAQTTGFKVSSKTDTSVSLKWSAAAGATGYKIQQYKNKKWTEISRATGTSYKVTSLSAATTYKFRIIAYNSSNVDAKASSTVTVTTKPKQVTGLKVKTRSDTAITLTWTKVAKADGYKVEQKVSGKWKAITDITKNTTITYKVSKLKASTAYDFRVRAYLKSGTSYNYGSYSMTLSASSNPSKVTNLKASAVTSTSVTLKWDKNTTGTGYKVQQYKSGKWSTIKTITKNSTVKYTVKGLKAGTAYKFRVKAYKGKLTGAASMTLNATTNLSQVKNLAASAKTKNTVTLKWDKNTSGSGYKVEQLVNGKWKVIKTITKNTTVTYKVTGLKAGTTYQFRVRAYKDKMYGAYSATLKVTTKK